MGISFDKALGVHESALKYRSMRAEVLSNNLANTDTPGFKARDIDFKGLLQKQGENQSGMSLQTTSSKHMSSGSDDLGGELLFRTPNQPSIDGNTVEDQVEHAAFMKNALDFQASFMMLNGRFKGLSSAIRGD